MADLTKVAQEAADAAAHLHPTPAEIAALDDTELLDFHRTLGAARRALDAVTALASGEIERRSSRELGCAGLAQASGFNSPVELVQSLSGSTRAEATKLVHVGGMLVDESPAAHHSALTAAISTGALSIDAVEAIRRGLGEADAATTVEALRTAVDTLIAAAPTLNADRLYRRARELRDELDQAGIARREQERRDLRYLKVFTRSDGMVAGSFLLDPEDGGTLVAALDTILSPRRGGPRFTDPTDVATAQRLVDDPRTTPQLAADALMDLLRVAIDAAPGTMFGKRRPAVRVIVTEESLSRRGSGAFEGMPDPISFETVERHLCDTGVIGVRFDDNGSCIDLGREQRLFSERQRIAMAVRDGGCLFLDCARPPSFCEAHHINQWKRDTGRTDLADGVLLCRYHHLLLHNNGWQITRSGAQYELVPPSAVDPEQRAVLLVSRTAAVRELVGV
ncbi:MAG: DUF222 domain-containing protein [Rhodoglobus sp.]